MEHIQKCLISELSRLKQSSKEAVENIEEFNHFKKYMHVERPFEKELKGILEEIQEKEQPHLVLVCGSVGDGKSHLISFMKETYPMLFERTNIHNDATESFSPNETSIDTLNNQLKNFTNHVLQTKNYEENKHLVVAINLGTLSNFLNSKYENDFTILKEFVNENKIIDEEQSNYDIDTDLPFRFINLSDYHLYELTKDGITSNLQESLLEKICDAKSKNPFYASYLEHCKNHCEVSDRCPVKKNFEMLSKKQVRGQIISQLAELNIKYKTIISTRTFLDFVYHVLVDDELDIIGNSKKITEKIKKMTNSQYLNALLPNRFYLYSENTELFREINNFEPGTHRTDQLDQLIITFFNTDNLSAIFKEFLSEDLLNDLNILPMLSQEKLNVEKKQLFISLIRFNKFLPKDTDKVIVSVDSDYEKYVQYLFAWNINDIRKIRHLYQDVIKSIYLWNGFAEKGNINLFLGKNQVKYRVSESLNLIPYVHSKEVRQEEKLERFLTHMVLEFEIEDKKILHKLNIDYHLFSLIQKIKEGYSPNSQDKNNFISFVDFITRIIKEGSQDKSIHIRNKIGNVVKEYKLSVDQFGYYEFKENS
jgi:DNA phosphorothioation-dependent restriction protein DptF